MRILHAPSEVAGQMALTAQGQRELGHTATAYSPPHPFAYVPGPDRSPRFRNRWLRKVDTAAFAASVPFRYDVIHYHYGRSLLTPRLQELDARLYRRLRRKLVVQFWGSDARLPSLEVRRNPFFVNAYHEDDATNRSTLRRWTSPTQGHVIFVDHAFDDPYFDHIHIVRQCVDTRRLQPRYPVAKDRPLVVHAPSNTGFKGTSHVRQGVRELRQKKQFDYLEVHGESHRATLEACSLADIVIDQLLAGSHGVFAVEAMVLGKPVLCYVREDVIPTYPPGSPIINVNPRTLVDVLEEILADPDEQRRRGEASREYAERVHDSRRIELRLLEVYDQLP